MAKPVKTGIGVALVCGALALASCGNTVIDDGKAEDAVKVNIERVSKLKVDSVDCPSDVDVDPGKVFACDVELADGRSAVYKLRIRDEDANVSFVSFKPAKN
jgi:hypothetical protein